MSAQRLIGFSQGALAFYLTQNEMRCVLVTSDEKSAQRLYSDLKFFDPETIYYPAWDVLPFDLLPPSERVTAQRMDAMWQMSRGSSGPIVAPVQALLRKVPRPDQIEQLSKTISVEQEIPRDDLVRYLIGAGYLRSSLVEELGQFSVRGSVVDVFTTDEFPLRIEFEDDIISSIRTFMSATQRSIAERQQITLVPVRELFHSIEDASGSAFWSKAFSRLRERASELSVPQSVPDAIETSLQNGILGHGVEHLWPLLCREHTSIFEYFPHDAEIMLVDKSAVTIAAESFSDILREQIAKSESDARLYPLPEDAFIEPGDFIAQLAALSTKYYEPVELYHSEEDAIETVNGKVEGFISNARLETALKISRAKDHALTPLIDDIRKKLEASVRVAIVAEHQAKKNRLLRVLHEYEIDASNYEGSFSEWLKDSPSAVSILSGRLESGFCSNSDAVQLYSEYEVFPESVQRQATGNAQSIRRLLGQAASLAEGDYVVHIEYGIGLYRGLTQKIINGESEDFLLLEYAEQAKLFVPIYSMGKVQKYSGAEGASPTLTKLGGKTWDSAKRKVQENVAELAGRLLTIMAERELKKGISFGEEDADDRSFADLFPFEETPDQASAIEAVYADMAIGKPMDRLVCGDVGYGKTEVALRAAFKAVNNGYQVALLVPTTVLAVQHFETFKERFADYPVEVRCLSRFSPPKENKQTIADLSEGKVDIAIGTHRLLQSDISFSKLGLLVIDEEHRFGVAAKEKLKRFRAEIDILTLTATPIPRTLNMSLVGIRDLSLIETPPVNRQIVRTFVSRYDERMTREAILRELGRNGQVFYIHNRVQSIAERAEEVKNLVPEARVDFAHGQMKERELEKVMFRFVKGEIDVLISTTIIESGLDIPNANTILIRDAHAFGLAELYQLRGRVGRSSRRAFAYLFVGDPKKLGEGAKKRLQVLQALDDLGIGFRLALQDMEIRGAGNLLGKDQSGQINAVGYELYSRILKDAVKDLRKRQRLEKLGYISVSDLEVDPEVNLGFPSHIPPFYIPDVAERLLLYQRMIGMESKKEVIDLEEEMEDRLGYIPREVTTLLQLMSFRVLMKNIGATSAYFRDGVLRVALHPEIELDTDVLLTAVRNSNGVVSLSGNHALLFKLKKHEADTPMDISKAFLKYASGLQLAGLEKYRQ